MIFTTAINSHNYDSRVRNNTLLSNLIRRVAHTPAPSRRHWRERPLPSEGDFFGATLARGEAIIFLLKRHKGAAKRLAIDRIAGC